MPNDTKLLGSNRVYFGDVIMSTPGLTGIMDEALHKAFCIAGLEERDAQHLRSLPSLSSNHVTSLAH